MEIRKSEYDTNEYREIRLDNGVVALLISKKHRRKTVARGIKRVRSDTGRTEEDDDEEESSYSCGSDDPEAEGGVERGPGETGESSDEDSDLSTGTESEEEDEDDSIFKAACAVCINGGSLSDPPDIPGLAHLLEHMVFMGSREYPGENTFDSFLSKHGGHSNASTDYEKTVFYFTIHPEFFKKALDMFAHFFASPLLLESSLEREIEAVDSEFQTSLQSDSDRLQRLLCSIANPEHPYSTFVWGNKKSLMELPNEKGLRLVDHLREFYKIHYSSHYMTVAVMSTDPLDDMEEWTRDSFSAVPHNQTPPPNFGNIPPAFNHKEFHGLYRVVPVTDVNEIQLLWQLPCLFDKYRAKPMEYISWLLGHEGEGSVLHHLKKKNLATEILVGNGQEGFEYNSCFSLFNCTVVLTDKGHSRIEECLESVFQYLHMLRKGGPQERIFREIQTVELNNFTFKEEEDPDTYTEDLCEAMQYYSKEDYLSGKYLFFEYDPKLITDLTESLTPDGVNVMWSSQLFRDQCPLKEEWFRTPYSSEDIPASWKDAWKDPEVPDYLHLPPPNPFIATDFTIKPPPPEPQKKYPLVVSEDERHKLWFFQDTEFSLPRAFVCLILENPVHKISARNAVLVEMLVELLSLNMSGTIYNAEVALLEYACSVENRGVSIKVNGLNEKLPSLFKMVVDSVASFSTTQGDFDMIKEGLRRSYRNSDLDPETFCRSTRLRVLLPQYWSSSQRDSEIDALTIQDLMELLEQYRAHMFAEMLIQGNMTPEVMVTSHPLDVYALVLQEAEDLAVYLCRKMKFEPLSREQRFKPGVKGLPGGSLVSVEMVNRDLDSPNTVIIDYYQCCPRTVRDSTIASLLVSCMEEPAFDDLRTKKQLGYTVSLNYHNYEMVAFSLTVVSQSAKNRWSHVHNTYNVYIHMQSRLLHDMI
jgi:nardilysin